MANKFSYQKFKKKIKDLKNESEICNASPKTNTPKKSSYQKLKDEVERLKKESSGYYNALKRSIQGTMGSHELFIFKTRFKAEDEFEKAIWNGSTGKRLKKGDKVKFDGMIYKAIKSK